MLAENSTGMPCTAKQLIRFELVMPSESEPDPVSSFTDLNLNLLVGGTVRSEHEYRELLSQCAFEVTDVDSLPGLDRRVIWAKVAN